jgi:hypothetical protein
VDVGIGVGVDVGIGVGVLVGVKVGIGVGVDRTPLHPNRANPANMKKPVRNNPFLLSNVTPSNLEIGLIL